MTPTNYLGISLIAVLSVGAVQTSYPSLASTDFGRTVIVINGAFGDDRAAALEGTVQLRAAIARARTSGRPVTIAVSGRFLLSTPIAISQVTDLTLTTGRGTATFTPASKDVTDGLRARQSDGLHIVGLIFAGFRENGIFVEQSQNVIIDRVIVRDTRSTGWSQGAIHLTGNVSNASIRNSQVQGADFAGVVADTTNSSNISGLRIIGNIVTNTCRVVRDCGAIYVNDRSRRSQNLVISGNKISGFGDNNVYGRGIYIDDWASHVIASGNHIAGPGRFALQIHGGHDNTIMRNTIDITRISKLIVYEPATDGSRQVMTNNTLSSNKFVGLVKGLVPTIDEVDRRGVGALKLRNNLQCNAIRCMTFP